MPYRPHDPPVPMLFGYDPVRDLDQKHLARLIERLVESEITPRAKRSPKGQPQFDPWLCLKVLLLGYVMGVRSSRQMERLCRENLAFLYLTRVIHQAIELFVAFANRAKRTSSVFG